MSSFQKNDLKWLDLAFEQAQMAADMDEVPVGALIVKDDVILGKGYNLKEKAHDSTAHAEIMAIREASQKILNWRLSQCTLYVSLEPCMMCLAASLHARVERVVYGTPDLKGGALSLGYKFHEDERLNHKFLVEHCDHEKSRNILKIFFKEKRLEKK